MVRICKQHNQQFSQELIDRINETIKTEPNISRRELSRRVCEWMNWRAPNGKLKEMSCRKALLDLNKRKIIHLPESAPFPTAKAERARFSQGIQTPSIKCSLSELGAIDIMLVPHGNDEYSRIWNNLMQEYHYLGAGPLCGSQLRYLVSYSNSMVQAMLN